MRYLAFLVLAGCGGRWNDQSIDEVHADFPMECGHAVAACEACHTADGPFEAVDSRCISCHEEMRPDSHDPDSTQSCESCHQPCGWEAVAGGHPAGFEAAEVHGTAFNLQDPTEGDCRSCHGADLRGDSAQGCDDCHAEAGHADWRTDCTFCHGGADGDTQGLPPHDLDGTSVGANTSFPGHREHADNDRHPAYGCSECHGTATIAYADAVTDPGHAIDGTAGRAEVSFPAGGSYDNGTCSNLDCHGNGLQTGSVSVTAGAQGCSDCHASPPTGTREHRDHDHDRVSCDWCHDSVASSSTAISTPNLHVDGQVQVRFSSEASQWGMTYSSGRCTGTCHVGGEGENHNESWR